MKLLALDPATAMGWAFYEWDPIDAPRQNDRWSSILCGSFHLKAADISGKCSMVRGKLRELRERFRPDFVVFEKALEVAPRYTKKTKEDLFANGGNRDDVHAVTAMVDLLKTALLRGGPKDAEALRLKKEIFGEEETINSTTISQLNRIAGSVQSVVEGMGLPFEEVRSQTWQSIIPKTIKGPIKDRVRQYCDNLAIVGKNEDARDAAVIAVWAVLRSQGLTQHIDNVRRSAA